MVPQEGTLRVSADRESRAPVTGVFAAGKSQVGDFVEMGPEKELGMLSNTKYDTTGR